METLVHTNEILELMLLQLIPLCYVQKWTYDTWDEKKLTFQLWNFRWFYLRQLCLCFVRIAVKFIASCCTRNSFNEIQIYSAVRFVYFENFSLQMEALERGRKHHNRFIVVPNIVPKSIFPLNGPRLIEKKVECL